MADSSGPAKALSELAPQLIGSFIDRISYSAVGTRDCLDVWLVRGPNQGGVVLSFEVVRYISIDKPDELEQSFVDEIQVSVLPETGDWPDGVERLVRRFPGLPELFWIKFVGPAQIELVCQVATVIGGQY
jgi:hypothetical protein